MRHVLDHGFVRLVDHMGDDLAISRAARVSYDAEGRPEDKKLIHYLWKNKHTSPFEAVTLTFEVKAPIFVLRQWHRHRTWCIAGNVPVIFERPCDGPEEFYVPSWKTIGIQDTDNKQARLIQERKDDNHVRSVIRASCESSFAEYNKLLAEGVPRELARTVLPLATYSHMFATVNLLNLFRFCELRLHPHAQYEIREYAHALLALTRDHVAPIACGAFEAWRDRE